MSSRRKTAILGAAGRDFHNFNLRFRDDERAEVVAFTATQIPDIEGRKYPTSLAGPLYPDGIPIVSNTELPRLIRDEGVEAVVFSYSDVPHEYVMHRAAVANSLGADFHLLDARSTMLRSRKPVIAVCAVRTGSGKSQTTRRVAAYLKEKEKKVAIVRHPMPYGNLEKQAVQRFAQREDLDRHECTIEEREEYEHHLDQGFVVFAGVDYGAILGEAEKEADIILWDGGNNDTPFFKPDLHITVADPHRPGHELTYYPGETNLLMADVVVINKVDSASPENVATVRRNVEEHNPHAVVVEADSPVTVERPEEIEGKRVLCVEDGPTLTHGEMRYGAAVIAARNHRAGEIVDPRPYAAGRIAETFDQYPEIGTLLPAMGYGEDQIRDLEATINAAEVDLVLIGTPIDLGSLIEIDKPYLRVTYALREKGQPDLPAIIKEELGI